MLVSMENEARPKGWITMGIKKIVVAGGGTIGSQIAYQSAYSGFSVTIYDRSVAAVAATKRRTATWDQVYAERLFATPAVVYDTNERIQYATDLETAVEGADLIIEAIPEVLAVKNEFYAALAKVVSAQSILVTNSSTFLPSQFATISGHPENFLALHFTPHVWPNQPAEIMGQPLTDRTAYQAVVAFVREIDMVPIQLTREQPAYILNTLMAPFLESALLLWEKGVAEPEMIDRAWMIATGGAKGPFGILDEMDLRAAYRLMLATSAEPGKEALVAVAQRLKTEMLDEHRYGQISGRGFYRYPKPAYSSPVFLKHK